MKNVKESQIAMIERSDIKELKEFINNGNFICDELLNEFAMKAPAEAIKLYHKRNNLSEAAITTLIERGDKELILWAVTEAWAYCNDTFSHDLIERGEHDEIMAFIEHNKYEPSYRFNKMLLERGNSEEVLKNFQKHEMTREFIDDMVQQGLLRVEGNQVFFDF